MIGPIPPSESLFLPMDDGISLHLLSWSGESARPVLILPGRGEPAAKYGPIIDTLKGRPVWALDWRGQGLSPRHDRPQNPALGRRGHVTSFDRLSLDLDLVLKSLAQWPGSRDTLPKPPLVIAHSMGAAVFLRWLQMFPNHAAQVSGALLVGPMLDIPTGPWPRWVARGLSRAAVAAGFGGRYAPGQDDWQEGQDVFEGNRRTSSPEHFAFEQALLRDHPALQVGGPTWQWVAGAYHLISRLWGRWPEPQPQIPITVAVGTDDPYVPAACHRSFFSRFPSSEVHWIVGGRHELMAERPPVQEAVWELFAQLCEKIEDGDAQARA